MRTAASREGFLDKHPGARTVRTEHSASRRANCLAARGMKKKNAAPVTIECNRLVVNDMNGKARLWLDASSNDYCGMHISGPNKSAIELSIDGQRSNLGGPVPGKPLFI